MNAGLMIDQGVALGRAGRIGEAEAMFRRVLQLEPDNGVAHQNLGVALQVQERHEEAVAELQVARRTQPTSPLVAHSLTQSLLQLQRPAEAIDACRTALAVHPDNAEVHGILAEALLMSGDFKHGWMEYEWRWKCSSYKDPRRTFNRPQWRGAGESLKDKTILLHCEQGFGDVIQFIRYATLLGERGANVVVQCFKELVGLVRRMPDVADVVADGATPPAFDLHVPLMSLPLAFNTTVKTVPADVPYLLAPPQAAAAWGERVTAETGGLRIGIAWGARPNSQRGLRKSIPADALAPLGELARDRASLCFFSLQKSSVAQASAPPPLPMVDWTAKLADFSDSAALIANLDLVISVDTAVAHLAGAMGKPTWLMLPYGADFRWMLDRMDSPWYPTMRLFRQKAAGDWPGVIADVAAALRDLVTSRNSSK